MGGMPCYPDCIKGHLYLMPVKANTIVDSQEVIACSHTLAYSASPFRSDNAWVGSYAMARDFAFHCQPTQL